RPAVCDHPARHVHAPRRFDGGTRQPAPHDDPGESGSRADCRVEYLSVVSDADRPVDGGLTMFQHLLVPLDGSCLAEAILPDAYALASALYARLTLLHITEKHAPATIHGEHHLHDASEAESYLRALVQQAAPHTLTVGWHIHADDERGVARMIVDQALEL